MSVLPQLREHIMFYRSQGLSFFPLPYRAKKDDKFKWGEYQTRRPTDAETKQWFGNGAKHNVAVVCGKVSGGLVVLDCDSEERFWELAAIIRDKADCDILEFTRVSQTGKGFHIWLIVKEPVSSAKFPKLDIKAEGGYILAPPSLHPEGREYKFLNPETPIKHIDSLLDAGVDLAQRKDTAPLQQENWVTEALKGIGEGGRNDTTYRLAAYFKNKHPQDITESLLKEWNKRNSPPMDEGELLTTIESAYKRNPLESPNVENNNIPALGGRRGEDKGRGGEGGSLTEAKTLEKRYKTLEEETLENVRKRENLSSEAREWIVETGGAWFSTRDLDSDLGIKTEKDKTNRRFIIHSLKAEGFLEKHVTVSGKFRYIDAYAEKIEMPGFVPTSLGIKLPFNLHKLVKMLPGTLIVNAGAADAGKTAWALNVCRLNLGKIPIYYFSSEMGSDELYDRISLFGEPTPEEFWANVNFKERWSNFADVVVSGALNIVDFLEMTEDYYKIAGHLAGIHHSLRGKGAAAVLIQKNRGMDLGAGGNKGLIRPRLYFTMDNHQLKIEKAKNWVNTEVNPNGMVFKYKLVKGCKFIIEDETV